MGNTIATGPPNLTLNDIHTLWKQQQQCAAQAEGLSSVPPEVEDSFRGFTHNLKAFRFFCAPTLSSRKERDGDTIPSLVEFPQDFPTSGEKRHSGNSSPSGKALPRLMVEPLDLGSSSLRLLHTDTYLLINICRNLASGEAGESPGESSAPTSSPLSPDGHRRTSVSREEACSASWVRGMAHLFTPRGLAASFCSNIASPVVCDHCNTAVPGFTYSLHILKGADACPLGPCEATLHALKLEKCFSSGACGGQLLLQTLFFNLGRSLLQASGGRRTRKSKLQHLTRNAKPQEISVELTNWKASLFGGLNRATSENANEAMSAEEVFERNALLRVLHTAQGSNGYDPALSGRYLQDTTTAPDTPASASLPATLATRPEPKVYPEAPKPIVNGPQGPPLLEIPRLKLNTVQSTDTGRYARIAPFLSPPRDQSGAGFHVPPVVQTGSLSSLAHKSSDRGGNLYADSPKIHEASESARTPHAPRYVRPPQITTLMRIAQNVHTRYRSLVSKCTTKKHSACSTITEPSIPLLSLANNFPTCLNFFNKPNTQCSEEKVNSTATDDMWDRAKRLSLAAPEATEVLPWLFVGGEEPARNRNLLLEKGITAVVNTVAFAIPSQFTDVFQYLSLCTSDSPTEPISSLFPVVNRFIDEEHTQNGGKVFVHCQQGVSRSCSFVIAYLMWHYGMCYDRAHELVHSKRGVCSPNAGFYVKLRLWERHLARPVLNRAYAYAPYTRCFPLPFVFHFALDFNPSPTLTTSAGAGDQSSFGLCTRSSIVEENKVLGGFAQVITEENPHAAFDTRLSYGIIFGRNDASIKGELPASLDTFFLIGSECDQIVAEHAREDWGYFLRYNYYTSKESISVNNRGESIHFSPFPGFSANPADHRVANGEAFQFGAPVLKELSMLEHRVSKLMLGQTTLPKPHQPFVQLRWETDPRWDAFLNQSGIIFEFASELGRSVQLKSMADHRKRTREEELHQHHSRGREFSTNVFVDDSAPLSGISAEGRLNSPPSFPRVYPNGRRGKAVRGLGGASLSRRKREGDNATVSDDKREEEKDEKEIEDEEEEEEEEEEGEVPPQAFHMAFVNYPFEGRPIFNTGPSLEELRADEVWAIAIAGSAPVRPNALYLWVGDDWEGRVEDVAEGFWTHLAVGAGPHKSECGTTPTEHAAVRIGEYVMEDVAVQLVHQGDEPDELLLFL